MHVLIAQDNRFADVVMEMGYISIPNSTLRLGHFIYLFGMVQEVAKLGNSHSYNHLDIHCERWQYMYKHVTGISKWLYEWLLLF